jgi:hypothetical protein
MRLAAYAVDTVLRRTTSDTWSARRLGSWWPCHAYSVDFRLRTGKGMTNRAVKANCAG